MEKRGRWKWDGLTTSRIRHMVDSKWLERLQRDTKDLTRVSGYTEDESAGCKQLVWNEWAGCASYLSERPPMCGNTFCVF